MTLLLLLAVFLLTWSLTWLLRRYALARQLLDVPNARSSHSLPTPRGGGVSFVLCGIGCVLLLGSWSLIDYASMLALAGAGAVVAVVGFVDDHRHIAARWRLLVHVLAVVWMLWWFAAALPVSVLGLTLPLGIAGYAFSLLLLVWLLNLYNFMDGIDGIASVEAICVLLGGALLYWLTGHSQQLLLPLALAAAVAGFLCWNLPPARIFMGDAGSGFLGIMLGGLMLQAALTEPALLWSWLIMLGVFMVDATVTLLHRWWRGERVSQAHRSHAYQFAARAWGSHGRVTGVVLLLNLLWLWPWALLVAVDLVDGLLALLLAYLPLIWLAWRYRAGSAEH